VKSSPQHTQMEVETRNWASIRISS